MGERGGHEHQGIKFLDTSVPRRPSVQCHRDGKLIIDAGQLAKTILRSCSSPASYPLIIHSVDNENTSPSPKLTSAIIMVGDGFSYELWIRCGCAVKLNVAYMLSARFTSVLRNCSSDRIGCLISDSESLCVCVCVVQFICL